VAASTTATSDRLTATRTAYDTVAVDYAELLVDELAGKPLDRALLTAFAEEVRTASGGAPQRAAGPASAGVEVADVGCGPGRVTAYLSGLGLDVFGVDLSPGMVAEARRRHPDLRFEVGPMTALPVADGGLGGLVAWYSVIHTPPERLAQVWAEFARALRPGSPLLLAFQVGADERVHLHEAYGHPLSLDVYRLAVEPVSEGLAAAGLGVEATVVREPVSWERSRQAYLLARRVAGGSAALGDQVRLDHEQLPDG
jgi:SAM-dependent methyltransferase